ncbi:MAG: histidine phosphatase family protein, partial [Eubacterium sp.]|nr:histidine phosphatase family protein [Eubacterium sp.]
MLYIIRHGKTDWNNLHKIQGRTDVPLNEEGRAMAREAAVEYKNVHFDVCYCSPLIRAMETAEILLEGRDVPIITDDRLMEMCFGVYEGVE